MDIPVTMSDINYYYSTVTDYDVISTSGIFGMTVTSQSPLVTNSTEEACPKGVEMEHITIPPNIFENFPCPFELKEFPAWELGLKITFYIIAIFMAVVGNAAVLCVIIFNKRMHSRTYFYIANLAFSDLMIGVMNMWVHLGGNITSDWPFSPLLCKLFPFFQIIALTASTGCMTVIAGERFFATVYPMKAKFSRIHKHVIVVVVVWVVAVAVAVPMLLVRRMSLLIWADRHQKWCEEVWPRYVEGPNMDPTNNYVCSYDHPQRRAYYTIQVVVMYFVPVAVTSVAYSFIGYTLRQRRAPGHQTDQVLEQQQKTKRRVMRMLIIVFAVFVVCWTPQEVIVLMDAIQPEASNQKIPGAFRYVAIYIAYFNSSLNPILYAGLNEKCRKAFWEVFKCNNLCRGQKVAPDSTNKVHGPTRASRPANAGNGTLPASQGACSHKKPLTLLQQGQPRLPPIHEAMCETWSNSRYCYTGDCDKDTQCDVTRYDDVCAPSPLVRTLSSDSSGTLDGTTGTTVNTVVTLVDSD